MFSRKRVYFQRKTKMFMKDVFERKCFEFSVVFKLFMVDNQFFSKSIAPPSKS